jgi:hypothetical protein
MAALDLNPQGRSPKITWKSAIEEEVGKTRSEVKRIAVGMIRYKCFTDAPEGQQELDGWIHR